MINQFYKLIFELCIECYVYYVLFYVCSSTEFSFLNKYYNLLYQTLIPNCNLTINVLKKHLHVSDDTKNYILEGASQRIKCQRVLNLLIVHLDRGRDFMQFFNLFNLISIVTDLPHKFIAGNYSICVCYNMQMCIYLWI